MDPLSAQEQVAGLDGMIRRLEQARTDEQIRATVDELAHLWREHGGRWSLGGALMGPVIAHMMTSASGSDHYPTRDDLDRVYIPYLRREREKLLRHIPGAPPGNVPTRPGCFGGTAAALVVRLWPGGLR